MPYLIDGHNLIPYIPGLSLRDLDDENQLIEVLTGFASRRRTRIEVFFDQAPPSRAGSQSFGRVKAHFVRGDSTADQAIIKRLSSLGNAAKNWTVVTSDGEIVVEAKSVHSNTLSSIEFARQILAEGKVDTNQIEKGEAPEISDDEVDYWLGEFNGDGI